jgi:hypothetical protein
MSPEPVQPERLSRQAKKVRKNTPALGAEPPEMLSELNYDEQGGSVWSDSASVMTWHSCREEIYSIV